MTPSDAKRRLLPIGGAGFSGTVWQEALVDSVAISFSVAIALAGVLALWGLRRHAAERS